jgi:N-formylglutamate amidohydrolase
LAPDDSAPVSSNRSDRSPAPFSVDLPDEQAVPLVFASPHSGADYPAAFLEASRLDPLTLRRSEDAFVDRLFAAAADHGAPLLKAHFPRAYVDPNREAFELDPAMFDGPLPDYVNAASSRVAVGLGTVARVVTSGEEIYRCKLDFAEVRQRIDELYFPYHKAMRGLIEATVERFGACLLVDCHSMPSVGGPMDSDNGLRRVDFVLGDCFGTACTPLLTEFVERNLVDLGYTVRRNVPYAGGYTTRHYGRPRSGVHALQIEVNRALYMDETAVVPTTGLVDLERRLSRLIGRLAGFDIDVLRAA